MGKLLTEQMWTLWSASPFESPWARASFLTSDRQICSRGLLMSSSTPFSHNLSAVKSAEAAMEVVVLR